MLALGAEKWSDPGPVLKAEPDWVKGWPGLMRNRGVKDHSRPSGLGYRRTELVFPEVGKVVG